MNRFIDQLNVSITTNRTCTLKCNHCYIAPHLFKDKTQMTKEHFMMIFDQVERLYALDGNLREVEWEAIGGETTMMPFEWWEEMLPYALGRIRQFNKNLKTPGSLNFLTNLIYKDKRYTTLFNKYGQEDEFCLYTSWEPDTNRFGNKDKMFPQFQINLKAIEARSKILDIILTKSVIEMGPEAILDIFVPLGITDLSIKMLSPYGSGKAFFEPNMIDFDKMTDFLIRLDKAKPSSLTFTPQEEMLSSLYRGSSFQCNGNFKYDLSVEPDGLTHFNASQTADEMALGFKTITIEDKLWAEKVLFENKVEENNKLTLKYKECNNCEYLHFCNAGWYHYKIHDQDAIASYAKDECPGYKKLWDYHKEMIGGGLFDRSLFLHKEEVKRLISKKEPMVTGYVNESDIGTNYDNFFENIGSHSGVIVNKKRHYGKSLLQRLWFYDDLGVSTRITSEILLGNEDIEKIIEHYVYGNFHTMEISDALVMEFVKNNKEKEISRKIEFAVMAWEGSPPKGCGDIIDLKPVHEELFRWCHRHSNSGKGSLVRLPYLHRLEERMSREAGFKAL